MAECHRKLGDGEARAIYERVVRDYADQKEAVAMARARLGVAGTAMRAKGGRAVWTGPKVDTLGTVSPDGRSFSFIDWETGDLAVHDVVTGDRRLTDKGTWTESVEFAEESAISRDGKQVAYSWFNKDFRYDLRLANLSGEPNPRRLFDNEDVEWMGPYDWTPDGKWIAVQISRKDNTFQIGLVSTVDGSLRALKSVDWRGATKLFFSPDGKYLAYDLPQSESVDQRDIFVLAIDGSREIPAVVHPANDTLMGWAPDGQHLVFGSDRTGAMGVWALAVSDGKIQGAPELVKPDIGRVWSMGLARSGALYYGFQSGLPDVYVASIDFSSGKLLSPPTRPVQTFIGSNLAPDWSPDGKYLSYVSQREQGGRGQLLVLHSMETGQTRELRLNLLNIYGLRYWAPDGRSIAARASDRKGRQGVYLINVETGEVRPLVLNEPGLHTWPVGWSPDGAKFCYRRDDSATKYSVVIERELASGKERELLRSQALGFTALSSDGRHLAFITWDRSTKSLMLMVIPVEGGQPKELVRVNSPESLGDFGTLAWTPDGRFVVFRRKGPERGVWQVSLADGKVRKIGLDMDVSALRLHHDGRQICFLSGQRELEVWVLENFLPTVSARK